VAGVSARVLVAYASRHGSTAGVAQRIAARLEAAGHRPEVHDVRAAGGLPEYDAVVFGSPVYDQRWLPEAQGFVRDREDWLSRRPVWLFSVGTFGDRKPLIGRFVPREPKEIAAIRERTRAQDYRVFAGVIDRHQWPGASRILFHLLGGRFGDNRDWPEVEAWADGIARSLQRRSAPVASGG
jgi:menaquinone-dependent protoporphyrinogen oxidase